MTDDMHVAAANAATAQQAMTSFAEDKATTRTTTTTAHGDDHSGAPPRNKKGFKAEGNDVVLDLSRPAAAEKGMGSEMSSDSVLETRNSADAKSAREDEAEVDKSAEKAKVGAEAAAITETKEDKLRKTSQTAREERIWRRGLREKKRMEREATETACVARAAFNEMKLSLQSHLATVHSWGYPHRTVQACLSTWCLSALTNLRWMR